MQGMALLHIASALTLRTYSSGQCIVHKHGNRYVHLCHGCYVVGISWLYARAGHYDVFGICMWCTSIIVMPLSITCVHRAR